MRLAALISMALVGIAALTACGGSSSHATPAATLTPTITLPPEKLTPPPTAQVAPGEVLSVQLVAPGEGWAMTSSGLKWTGDSGQTWRDITPPGVAAQSIESVFFLDAEDGWAATILHTKEGHTAPSTVMIFRTNDGAKTWQQYSFEGPPLANYGPPTLHGSLQFTDVQHGWFLGVYMTGLQGSPSLFRTTDGGVTWINLPAPVRAHSYSVRFVGPLDGWFSAGGSLSVYATHDGGFTWQAETLQTPADCTGGAEYDGVGFFDGERGVVPVGLDCSGERNTTFYLTEDGGASWVAAATRKDNGPATGTTSIITFTTWLVSQGNLLFETGDRGRQWNDITPNWPSITGTAYDYVFTINFVTERYGWITLVTREGTVQGQTLVATADGGHTWRLLQP
jgi:hypothetical protein